LNVFILQNYQYININIKNINIRISVRAKTTLIGPNDFHCLDKKNYLFQNNFYVPQKKVNRISNETMVSKWFYYHFTSSELWKCKLRAMSNTLVSLL